MSHLQQALTEDELARLADFLDAIGSPAMNIKMLDGYFSALICGPVMVLPSKYLPQIWGEDFSFDNGAQATDIVGLHHASLEHDCIRTASHAKGAGRVFANTLGRR